MKVLTRSKTPTGTGRRGVRVAGMATQQTLTMRTVGKSKGSDSTSARRLIAKSATQATGTTIVASATSNRSPVPVYPRVDIGPKAYKVYRNQDRLVVRFTVDKVLQKNGRGGYVRVGRYYVWDMDTGQIATRTKKSGYLDKKEAVKVAREYRDRYGAYVRVGF